MKKYIYLPHKHELDTEIIKRFSADSKVHVHLKDTIVLDPRYNLLNENPKINEREVSVYERDDTLVYIMSEKPMRSKVSLSIDDNIRMYNLKHSSIRYLISSILWTYYNRLIIDFNTYEDYSTFTLMYDSDKFLPIVDSLQGLTKKYIEAGIDINSNDFSGPVTTEISSIYKGRFLGPHFLNTAEIPLFNFSILEIDGNYITYKYEEKKHKPIKDTIDGQISMDINE